MKTITRPKRAALKAAIFAQFQTDAAFANAVGLSPARLSLILHGRADPSNEEIRSFSSTLGIGQKGLGI